jgi:hypothetical protein
MAVINPKSVPSMINAPKVVPSKPQYKSPTLSTPPKMVRSNWSRDPSVI